MMATRPSFGIERVKWEAKLPKVLTEGTLYFVDEDGTIRVNHGDKVISYGGRAQNNNDNDNAALRRVVTSLQAWQNSLQEWHDNLTQWQQDMQLWQTQQQEWQDSLTQQQQDMREWQTLQQEWQTRQQEQIDALIGALATVAEAEEIPEYTPPDMPDIPEVKPVTLPDIPEVKPVTLPDVLDNPLNVDNVEEFMEDLFSNEEIDASDIPEDDVTAMLDDVFDGTEELQPGEVDDDWVDYLDLIFGDDEW